MDFNPENPLPLLERQTLKKYFTVESQYMAAENYIGSEYEILRKNALRIIFINYNTENFDAFIPYLAVNYFDRYVSRHGLPLPHTGKLVRDEVCLVALCCLTIAWKMRNNSFQVTKFLSERKLKINGKHILKVELQILNGLDWKMRSLMPFAFLDHFVKYFRGILGLKRGCINQIIVQAQGDINYTQFNPSVVAASALLAAFSFLYHIKIQDYTEIIVSRGEVQKEPLMICLESIIGLCIKHKILMESTAQQGGTETFKIQAGESSKPAAAKVGESSASSQKAGEEETEESQREGKELMEVTRRPGKEPMEVEVAHRPGKEPMWEISEIIQEEPDSKDPQTNFDLKWVTESKDPQMNFELKWITEENENEDLTINSPLFRQLGDAPLDGVTATAEPNKFQCPICNCCIIL